MKYYKIVKTLRHTTKHYNVCKNNATNKQANNFNNKTNNFKTDVN